MMKIYPILVLTAGLTVAGCTGPVILGAEGAAIYASKPSKEPPADIEDQMAPHASWCYRTMGEPECYTHAQNVPADRLINVDPENEYPLDAAAHRSAAQEALVNRYQVMPVVSVKDDHAKAPSDDQKNTPDIAEPEPAPQVLPLNN